MLPCHRYASTRWPLLAVCLVLAGCRGPRLLSVENAPVHVVLDSPIVEDLVDKLVESHKGVLNPQTTASISVRSLSYKSEQELASRIGKQPGYDVPGQTGITILRESQGLPYSMVRLEDGPFQGKVGWVARVSIDDPRTSMP